MAGKASTYGAQDPGPVWIKALEHFKKDTCVDLLNVDENPEPLRERLKVINDEESLSAVAHKHHDGHTTVLKALRPVFTSASNVLGNIKWLLRHIQDVE